MTSKQIYKICSDYYEVDLTQKTRREDIIFKRSVCNVLCRELTKESFDSIGRNLDSDPKKQVHATVLHSIKKFRETYFYQKQPFDVEQDYLFLKQHILKIIEDETEDKQSLIMASESVMIEKYQELYAKYKLLKINKETLANKLANKSEEIVKTDRFSDVLKELKEFSDEDILDFIETRLKPYKKALESRIKPKVITEVAGAMLIR